MKMVKGLLLGSAASIAAVVGAQAADLPVKAKPVEYVRVCSTYGAGFYYIPGTESCVRIGGYVRNQWTINGNSTQFQNAGPVAYDQRSRDWFVSETRGAFSFDVRNNTQYGVLRAYYQAYITTVNQGSTAAGINPSLQTAYIQLAGFTAGRFLGTYYTAWDTDIGSYSTSSFTGRDTSQSEGVEYRAQFGNGVSAAIGAFAPRRSGIFNQAAAVTIGTGLTSVQPSVADTNSAYHMPDIQGDVRVEQAWGGVHFGALVHELNVPYNGAVETSGYPQTRYGWAVNASLQLKQLPTGAGDTFVISGQYTKGALQTVQATVTQRAFALFEPGDNSGFYNSIAFGFLPDSVYDSSGVVGGGRQQLTEGWSVNAGFTHYWLPSVLRTSIYGHMQSVSFTADAKRIICFTTAGVARFGAGLACDPDFKQYVVGSRTAWNITPNLEISGDILYQRFDTASSGVVSAGLPASKPAGFYNVADQGQFMFISRFIRSW